MKKVKYRSKKLWKHFTTIYIEVDNKIKNFDETEIKKYKFHQHKSLTSIDNTVIIKRVVFNMVFFGKKNFKYSIGYKDAKKIRPYGMKN